MIYGTLILVYIMQYIMYTNSTHWYIYLSAGVCYSISCYDHSHGNIVGECTLVRL